MIKCYIGIGSNLNNPIQQIEQAIQALSGLEKCQLARTSSLYQSSAMGPQNQPNYVNAVARLDTELEARALLWQLQQLEQNQGRVRGSERWTARTLDLDILLYGDQIINNRDLIIPHPGLSQRNFVLYPLQEIAPELRIPQLGLLSELIAGCELGDLVKLQ